MFTNHAEGKIDSFGKNIREYKQHILVTIVFLLAYIPTFIWMWDRWFVHDSYYSHGILVPFVSLFLIWQKRDELKNIGFQPSRWATSVIVGGIVMYILSAILRVYFIAGFSMLIVLTGFILYFYGEKVFQKIWFPVLFLIFMIPLPLVVITNISFTLKILAAKLATFFLNHIGMPAVRDGSLIAMKHTHVMVEDVCSGLRSLISLTALGSIFTYLMKAGLIKKTVLFLSTIPIAIITNALRIVFLATVSEIWGAQYATGFIHDFSGFMIFVFAFLLLFSVEKLLE